MLSYIIEIIVMLFYQFLRMRFLYIRRLNTMLRYMHYKKVEPELSAEIIRFYEYLWVESRLLKDKDNTELSTTIYKLPQVLRCQLFRQLLMNYFSSAKWMLQLPHNLYDHMLVMVR